MSHPLTRAAGLVLVAATLLAGCSSDERLSSGPPRSSVTTSPTAVPVPDPVASYVAIGDSFTAGPGIPTVRPDSGSCFRSDRNWPSLLSATLQTRRFADVSCSGADTDDVLTGQYPQVLAVEPTTELVTIGIGGNDGGLFTSLLGSCVGEGSTCGAFAATTAPAILATTSERVEAVVEAVRAEAPRARILLVGYLRIMPDAGTCPTASVTGDAAGSLRKAEDDLQTALAGAASRSGIGFVSMREAGRGHDVCAGDEAWINGTEVRDGDGAYFHPRSAGMRAVADAVARHLAADDR